MRALFTKRIFGLRTNLDAVEFALDLTIEAIVLYERPPLGAWKKFASAQLDDPEFPIVIGLLRNEAEAHSGGRRPVRLWLPGEQVLQQQVRIEAGPPAERLRAVFDYIGRETVYRPKDVAVAVAPSRRNGETTVLITFAETWREARDYAARWGFEPGVVSTRHHVEDFGADGPVFHVQTPQPEPRAPIKRKRLAIAGLAVTAIAAGAAVWSQHPWVAPSGLAETGSVTNIEVAEATAISHPPVPVPAARPAKPEAQVEFPPPKHFSESPVLVPHGDVDDPLKTGKPPIALSTLPPPDALATPAVMAAALSLPPIADPAPPMRALIAGWTGPVPTLQPLGPNFPSTVQRISTLMEAPVRAESIALLVNVGSPPEAPPTVHALEPPPIETADAAETALPAQIAVPRRTATLPNGKMPAALARDPVTAGIAPAAAPEPPGPPAPPGAEAISAVKEAPAAAASVSPLAEIGALPPASPAAPAVEPAPAEASTTPADAAEIVETAVTDTVAKTAKMADAPPAIPFPKPKPGRGEPEGGGAGSGVDQRRAMFIPPPRSTRSSELAAELAAEPVVEATAEPAAEPVAEPAAEPEMILAAVAPVGGAATAPVQVENPDAPTKFASLTSPVPKTRPPLPALPRVLPSIATLPPITGTARRSIRAAATEQGLPLDRTALIGILNLDSGRKALLRLPNGRYQAVIVGDVLDGWRVSMIGVDAMRITRSGEDHTLLLVNR